MSLGSLLQSLRPGGGLRERLLPARRPKGDIAVYSDAVGRLPFNAYNCLVALWFIALYKAEFEVQGIYQNNIRGLHSAVMRIVVGMTEIPLLGGLANALVMVVTRGQPGPARIRAFNIAAALQQTLVALGCVLIQAFIPVTVLLEWVREGADSFDDLFDVPDGVRKTTELLLVKALVGTYVLYWIHRQDAANTLYLLIVAHHNALHGRLRVSAIATLTCLLCMPAQALVYLVSLAVIARCATPMDVVLSGAGALFILDVDDVLALTSEKYYEDIKEMMVQDAEAQCNHLQQDEEQVTGGAGLMEAVVIGDEPSDYPLVWLGLLFILSLVGFWLYFLYRLYR